jgi:hypothetical protein
MNRIEESISDLIVAQVDMNAVELCQMQVTGSGTTKYSKMKLELTINAIIPQILVFSDVWSQMHTIPSNTCAALPTYYLYLSGTKWK